MIAVNFNVVGPNVDPNFGNVGLGNCLFQYAVCRITAIKNGYNFFIPEPKHIKNVFPKLDMGMIDGNITYEYQDDNYYNPAVFGIPDNTFMRGWYQSEKYFVGFEDQVRDWFSCEMDDKTKLILDKYPPEKFCYLHLRGGDNKQEAQRSLGWNFAKKYYTDAIEKVKKSYPDLNVVIVTDDVELAKDYFPEIPCLRNDISTDFKLLYFSDYLIMSATTFAWWPAWLRPKVITIAPKYWLNHYNMHFTPGFEVEENRERWYPQDIETKGFTYIERKRN